MIHTSTNYNISLYCCCCIQHIALLKDKTETQKIIIFIDIFIQILQEKIRYNERTMVCIYR